jgi:hypothetical protein
MVTKAADVMMSAQQYLRGNTSESMKVILRVEEARCRAWLEKQSAPPEPNPFAEKLKATREDVMKALTGGTTRIDLTDQEISTILAALRTHQNINLGSKGMSPDMYDIATNDGSYAPMLKDEVDELCERLNLSPRD